MIIAHNLAIVKHFPKYIVASGKKQGKTRKPIKKEKHEAIGSRCNIMITQRRRKVNPFFEISSTRLNFIASPALPFASRFQKPFKLGTFFNYQIAYFLYHCPCFWRGFHAQSLCCNGHKFFGVHVPNHVYRRVLRSFVAVVFGLPVVALRPNERLSMYMTT